MEYKAGIKVVKIDKDNINETLLREQVVPILQNNNLVAFPTETVYGLGANALSEDATKKIFAAKGRPADNPLIVHIANYDQLKTIISEDDLPKTGSVLHKLCTNFWPGPLTILFPSNEKIPKTVTAGLPTVAIRMPSHPIARKIIELSGLPIAAPSANRSGRPSPTSAEHVLFDFANSNVNPHPNLLLNDQNQISNPSIPLINDNNNNNENGEVLLKCIVDGGDCDVGLESTVLDLNHKVVEKNITLGPVILRPGSVTLEQLLPYLPNLRVYSSSLLKEKLNEDKKSNDNNNNNYSNNDNDGDNNNDNNNLVDMDESCDEVVMRPATPGLKYVHYSPNANVVLVEYSANMTGMRTKIIHFLRSQLIPSIDHITDNNNNNNNNKNRSNNDDNGVEMKKKKKRIGIIRNIKGLSDIYREFEKNEDVEIVEVGSKYEDLGKAEAEVAHELFRCYRQLDQSVEVILIEGVPTQNLGLAVMNRVSKSANMTL